MLLASLGSFMAALDVVIVATAMPTMRVELHAGLSQMEWTINAYNLVFAVLLLTGAALGDRFGRRRMYVGGLLLFAATSAASALSTTAGELIAARVAQGVAGAVLVPLTLTLISEAFPAEKRGAAIGIWGGVTGLGVAAGPVLGGVIVQEMTWQWIFWFNVPVALAVAAGSLFLLTESRGPRPQLDVPGLALAGTAMFALTWAPVRAPDAGWASAEVVGALVAGAVLAGGFVLWERRARFPMMPLEYFRNRGFATANIVNFFLMVSLIGSLFFITQLFQTGLGYSPMQAGARILVWMAMPMVVAPLAGALADKVGNKPFMLAGMLMQGGGAAWLAVVASPHVSYGTLVAPLIVSGVGISMCFPTVANAVTGSVPAADAGIAAGVNVTLRELGGVFGVAILGAVFAAHGGYASPEVYVAGFRPAMWVAALVPVGGAVAAAFAPGKPKAVAGGTADAGPDAGEPTAELVVQAS
ncbi:MAG: MFS transporter [Catenulispora sp.]|nr:MFS transporter [Catenulispora sp.]